MSQQSASKSYIDECCEATADDAEFTRLVSAAMGRAAYLACGAGLTGFEILEAMAEMVKRKVDCIAEISEAECERDLLEDANLH